MPEHYYLVDFKCPQCKHWDENVRVPEKEYRDEKGKINDWLSHTCSECGCDFKQRE